MSEYMMYHNPRCSKSRTTLALLQERGIEPDIILYLEDNPSADEIEKVLGKLGIAAAQLVRRNEDEYKQAGLNKESSEQELIDAMAAHPKLIERPVVIRGQRAVLGRPPENVLDLLD